MQILFLGRFPLNLTQEVQPLGVAMPLRTARDDGLCSGPRSTGSGSLDALPKTPAALASNCFFHSTIWLGCSSNGGGLRRSKQRTALASHDLARVLQTALKTVLD